MRVGGESGRRRAVTARGSAFSSWCREQSPSLDGDWLTADAADGSGESIAVMPPGIGFPPSESGDGIRCWRMAKWDADAPQDLIGIPPDEIVELSLDDVLSIVPAKLERWVKTLDRPGPE